MFSIDKNSWHFKLVQESWGKRYREGDIIDFCEYFRAVVGSIALYFLLISLFIFTVFIALKAHWEMFAVIKEYLIFGEVVGRVHILAFTGFIVYLLGAIYSFFIGCGYLINKCYSKAKQKISRNNSSFVALSYRKFKDKVCFKVRVK